MNSACDVILSQLYAEHDNTILCIVRADVRAWQHRIYITYPQTPVKVMAIQG